MGLVGRERNEDHWKRRRGEIGTKGFVRVSSNYFFIISFSAYSITKSECILDSGCSDYCCINRDWFSTHIPLEIGVVLLGNVFTCHRRVLETSELRYMMAW